MMLKRTSRYFVIIFLITIFGASFVNAEPYDGFTFFNPLNSRTTYLLDMDNDIVHRWNHDRNGGYATYLLKNGNILRPAQVNNPRIRGAAYSGLIQEKNWEGETVWEFEYNTATQMMHHDIEPMPNGNILAIAWEVKSAEEARQAGRRNPRTIWPFHIIEINRDPFMQFEDIVWEWHAWDHLIQDFDEDMDNFGVVGDHPELIDVNLGRGGGGPGGGGDWLHINGISYNPDLDQIVFSSHFTDEIYIVDHSTTTEEAAGHEGGNSGRGGDILYRWGCPSNYDAEGEQQFDIVHCSWWVPEGLPGAGNILAFNNGEGARASEIVEIVLPRDEEGNYILEEGQAYGPEEPVWSYADGRTFYSNHLGGCQRLPNGNTLITESTDEHILEVDAEGNIVWEHNNRNQIARSLRYAHDFPGVYQLHPVEEGALVINEFLADNQETETDQDDEFDDWIEIYNNSDDDLSLWGFYLSDNLDDPDRWNFPDTSIAANDYVIVWADEDIDQEGLHVSFDLSEEGGVILLSAPDETLLDRVVFNEQVPDSSFGRDPNGTGDFVRMEPTFGDANFEAFVMPDYDPLVINEILVINDTTAMDQDGEYDAWIELFNNGDIPLPLEGVFLSNVAENLALWTFPEVTIDANGYLIIWIDGDVDQDGLHADFTLSGDSDWLVLANQNEERIGEVSLEGQISDISFGRYPNGTGDFIEMTPSFAAENNEGIINSVEDEDVLPNQFSMLENYPNPFNSTTTIRFTLQNQSEVKLAIFNSNGKLIRMVLDGTYKAGSTEVVWDGAGENGVDVCSGVYLYTLQAGSVLKTGKALLIR